MLTSLPYTSAVVDEPPHVTSGYLALVERDLTINREHPPFVKSIAALPLLLLDPVLPPADPSASRGSEDFEFGYSREFLYKANDADALLRVARLPVIGLSLVLGAVLFLWGGRLIGGIGGLVSLFLAVFEPNLLAHGRLVTTDLGAALFALATWACLYQASALLTGNPAFLRWALLAGGVLGLAFATRFSSLLLIPLVAITLLLDKRSSPRVRLRLFVILLLTATLVVNLVYLSLGAGFALFPLGSEPVVEAFRTEPLASLEAHTIGRWIPIPLPRLFLEGLDLARYKNLYSEGPGYLNGDYSAEGWWSYFLLAIGMKSTLPFLVLAIAGTGLALRHPASRILTAYLLVPCFGFLFLVTALTRAQIGLRYVLPCFPFLCLLAALPMVRVIGAAGTPVRRALPLALTVMGLLGWHAAAALNIHPYHLAYFNPAAGGPDKGYHHLVDSNLDWGQDLVGVHRFMEEHDLDGLNLYYFGTADPAWYGIRRNVPPRPGWYFVSATHLMGVYLPDRDMLAGFRDLTPETSIGHSILVYRLDEVPPFLNNPPNRP